MHPICIHANAQQRCDLQRSRTDNGNFCGLVRAKIHPSVACRPIVASPSSFVHFCDSLAPRDVQKFNNRQSEGSAVDWHFSGNIFHYHTSEISTWWSLWISNLKYQRWLFRLSVLVIKLLIIEIAVGLIEKEIIRRSSQLKVSKLCNTDWVAKVSIKSSNCREFEVDERTPWEKE